MDLEFATYMLRDQVHRDGVVVHPGDNHVRELFAGKDILIKRRLDRAGVLREDVLHTSAPFNSIAPNAPGQPHVVVGVDEYPHVAAVENLGDVQREDAFDNHNIRGVHVPRDVRPALAGDEVVDRDIEALPPLQAVEALSHRLYIEGTRLIKIHIRNVGALLGGQVPIELVEAQQHNTLVPQSLRDTLAHRRLAARSAPGDPNKERLLRTGALHSVGLRHGPCLHGDVQLSRPAHLPPMEKG
mmetsp:Transcript_70109/g.208946  ORF Transcript_70109/g.208946 Transcript_70109/m.208946 type:complete len:242 (-) Transcript_70109:15-740(-)